MGLTKLKNADGTYVKNALVLVYLARFYPSTVSVMKGELTGFGRKFIGIDINMEYIEIAGKRIKSLGVEYTLRDNNRKQQLKIML